MPLGTQPAHCRLAAKRMMFLLKRRVDRCGGLQVFEGFCKYFCKYRR
jgi:hypothetical protein